MATQILNRIGSEEEFFTLSQAALSSRLEFSGRITDNTYRSELLDKARAEGLDIWADSGMYVDWAFRTLLFVIRYRRGRWLEKRVV